MKKQWLLHASPKRMGFSLKGLSWLAMFCIVKNFQRTLAFINIFPNTYTSTNILKNFEENLFSVMSIYI